MTWDMEAARRTVCANAVDAAEARELMLMLGIYPGEEEDIDMLNLLAAPHARSRRLQ